MIQSKKKNSDEFIDRFVSSVFGIATHLALFLNNKNFCKEKNKNWRSIYNLWYNKTIT